MSSNAIHMSNPWSALQRFARPAPPVEKCEMCAAPLGPGHAHLVEVSSRRMLCACDPCALLFGGHAETPYRRVPRDTCALPDFQLSDFGWTAFAIPIGLACIFTRSGSDTVTAMYPSPGGPIECDIDRTVWDDLMTDNPALRQLEFDTQALLIHRVEPAREYFLAPIDECYRLVGLIRSSWRGLSGGRDAWERIGQFFSDLRHRARRG
jgi:hypothetical protein